MIRKGGEAVKSFTRSFRFSLSTLLLFCAFAGAVIGCWTQRQVWRRSIDFPSAGKRAYRAWNNDYLAFNPGSTKLAVIQNGGGIRLFNLNEKKCEWNSRIVTCGYAVLQFNESDGYLEIGDYLPGPLQQTGRRVPLLDGQTESTLELRASLTDADLDISRRDDSNITGSVTKPTLFFNRSKGHNLMSPSPDGQELAIPGPPGRTACCYIRLPTHWYVIDTGDPVVAARYSSDSQSLAMLHEDGAVSVWRRNGAYGVRGWALLPIFWIALALGLTLVVRLGMHITSRRHNRVEAVASA